MKVILSRKGFDSSAGGYASFIYPNGKMQSLPIPSTNDSIRYSEVTSLYKYASLYETMKSVNPKIRSKKMVELTQDTTCHLDPDLDENSLIRPVGWRGCFGQCNAAQTVLAKNKVGHNDLFLFFGWFKNYIENEKPSLESGEGKHVIFGYLQIDEVLYTKGNNIPEWLQRHPHGTPVRSERDNNCIYIARKSASWNALLPGYGIFKYSPDLVLTKEGYSRSKWNLPDIFKNADIGYHNSNSWKDDYFQSACRGQEFVIQDNDAIEEWAKNIINIGVRYNGVI